MKIRMFGVLVLGVLIAAGVAYAQKVNTDFDSSAAFTTYKTYAWTAGTPSPNPLGEQRIHDAVNAQLAAKGMTEVATSPDAYVATHVTTQERQTLIANGFGPWGYGVGFGGGIGGASVETYTEGTLVVDLYDARTKKMVWRGSATGTASDKPSKNTSKVDKALEKMFEKYPPS